MVVQHGEEGGTAKTPRTPRKGRKQAGSVARIRTSCGQNSLSRWAAGARGDAARAGAGRGGRGGSALRAARRLPEGQLRPGVAQLVGLGSAGVEDVDDAPAAASQRVGDGAAVAAVCGWECGGVLRGRRAVASERAHRSSFECAQDRLLRLWSRGLSTDFYVELHNIIVQFMPLYIGRPAARQVFFRPLKSLLFQRLRRAVRVGRGFFAHICGDLSFVFGWRKRHGVAPRSYGTHPARAQRRNLSDCACVRRRRGDGAGRRAASRRPWRIGP